MPETPVKLADVTPAMRLEYDEVKIKGAGQTFFVSHRIGIEVQHPPLGPDGQPDWNVLVVEVEADPRDVTTRNDVLHRLGLSGF